MTTSVHQNSIESYHGLDLTKKQAEVVRALGVLSEATDEQLADHLKYTVNRITGRITELLKKKVVIEDHNITGNFGKPIRVCRLREYNERLC